MKLSSMFAALLVGAGLPMTAHALCDAGHCEGIGAQVTTQVFLHGSGDIWLKGPADRAALRCTLVQGNYMVLSKNRPLFKESYAAILTALSTNRSWLVRIVEGSSNCTIDYIMMTID